MVVIVVVTDVTVGIENCTHGNSSFVLVDYLVALSALAKTVEAALPAVLVFC